MDEKRSDMEVLLVADKDDGGNLKVVDKASAKDGILRLLLPSMENLEDFMKVERNTSILEDFFQNLGRQYKQPTDFRFYQIPASLLETLDVFTDMLKAPDENKDFISQYEVKPEDYASLEQQTGKKETQSESEQQATGEDAPPVQSATTEQSDSEQQQRQPSGIESRVDWEQLARMGVTRESLEQSGDLTAVLSGRKSSLITISTEVEGIPITTQGRIHFQEGNDGKLDLKIDCYRQKPDLDLPFLGVLLDKEVKDNILATGNAGQPINLTLNGNEPKPCLISLDKVTNNLIAIPTDDILIPNVIKDVTLTPEQHQRLSEGRKVLVEGMTSQWNNKFDAYMQYNVAKEQFEYTYDGLDRNRYKKQENEQRKTQKRSESQPQAQAETKSFFIPKKLLGKELTPEQQTKFGKMETIYVTGMTDKEGKLFNAYVRMNLERGKPNFFKYNPDKAQSRAREITPTAEHKTQVAVNNGATSEATKYVKKPLKSAQGQPEQAATAKKEVKKKAKSVKM